MEDSGTTEVVVMAATETGTKGTPHYHVLERLCTSADLCSGVEVVETVGHSETAGHM